MGSREGALKNAQNMIDRHGVTPDGKSVYHQEIAKKASRPRHYFSDLKASDPAKLAEISRKGAQSANAKKIANQA